MYTFFFFQKIIYSFGVNKKRKKKLDERIYFFIILNVKTQLNEYHASVNHE